MQFRETFYCQSFLPYGNLLSVISCYKFYVLEDQQENMKLTIIYHLATFLFIYTV